MNAVPRKAEFDDLRVGQWVAWTPESGASCGKVVSKRGPGAYGVGVTSGNGDVWPVTLNMCERGEVTILRDVPAAPVTVRREDYDRLVDAVATSHPDYDERVHRAVRALIDNADTGDDQ